MIKTIANARTFALGGNATITLKSVQTGTEFTYRIRKATGPNLWFVDAFLGSDNTRDYAFIGSIRDTGWNYRYRCSAKGVLSADDPRSKALGYLMHIFNSREEDIPPVLEFWTDGTCSACGRKLTNTASLEVGMGPVCYAANRR